ncbi:MAG: hypothetical protein ACRCY8_15305 [Dermatophilaceae bacterium]
MADQARDFLERQPVAQARFGFLVARHPGVVSHDVESSSGIGGFRLVNAATSLLMLAGLALVAVAVVRGRGAGEQPAPQPPTHPIGSVR